jgi:hypothetical protein
MKTKCMYRMLPAALVIMLSAGCDGLLSPDPDIPGRIYFNSFELSTDTVGWRGYAGIQIVRDAPSPGGLLSARVSGGCIVPHAYADIPGPHEDSYLVLGCWGKNLSHGGGLSLSLTRTPQNSIRVSITDTVWTAYASGDTLFCPAGDSLHIEMMSGGILASAMLVDLLEIRSVR